MEYFQDWVSARWPELETMNELTESELRITAGVWPVESAGGAELSTGSTGKDFNCIFALSI